LKRPSWVVHSKPVCGWLYRVHVAILTARETRSSPIAWSLTLTYMQEEMGQNARSEAAVSHKPPNEQPMGVGATTDTTSLAQCIIAEAIRASRYSSPCSERYQQRMKDADNKNSTAILGFAASARLRLGQCGLAALVQYWPCSSSSDGIQP